MGLGQFFNILEYVCSRTDTYFAKVDKNYTSQICPNCGTHTGKKKLNVRVHQCSECRYEQDRDVAAAEVVRIKGLNLSTAVGATVVKQPSNGVLAGAKA
jgi:putative transposase